MTDDQFRVVFVTKSDLSGQAGHNIITRNIALAFARTEGVRTTVVSPTPSRAAPESLRSAATELVPLSERPSNPSIPHRLQSVSSTFRTLRSVLRDGNPDLVVARMAPDMLAAPFLAKRYDIPYALLARGTSYKRLRFSALVTRIYRYNLRTARHVYAASDEIKRDADKMRRAGQPEVTLLSNAVDPAEFEAAPIEAARSSIGLDVDGFVVGFVGSMKRYHKIDVLVRSLNHLERDDVHLLLVGEGPELERYRSIAREMDVADRVHCTGFVPHDEVDQFLSASDVLYAVRSQTSATPVKVFEYLACERPVIVREMSELSFVTDLDLGLTVAEPDPELVAAALDECYRLDAATRREMGRRGRDYVERECTWDAFARQVINDSR